MYLKASTGTKISTFLEKNGGMRLWITKWTFKISCAVLRYSKVTGLEPCQYIPSPTAHTPSL